MSMNLGPFTPATAGTVSRTVSGTSASVALFQTGNPQTILITSLPANATAFIEFGTSAVAAVAATGTPVLPGTIMTFTVGPSVTHVAAIGSAGTLYFTSGHGA